MYFENPNALYLLLALPPLLFGLGLWGWKVKKKIAAVFPLNPRRLRRKQLEKYFLAGVIMALFILAFASPRALLSSFATQEKTGEIALLVDVSNSMAAQKEPESSNRLEQVRPILYDIIDRMEELGQVKISVIGFTNIARSYVPFVGKEDYDYLRESIKRVIDINSIPGPGTSIGQPVLDVADKFSIGGQAKLIIYFSDGELFSWISGTGTRGMTEAESRLIEDAVEKVTEEGIRIITVGIGEREGAKIPVMNFSGEFVGEYAMLEGIDYISYLEEDSLKDFAHQTGGEYFSQEDIKGLIEFIEESLDPITSEDIPKEIKSYPSVAHWFILGSIPFLALLVRRHLLA